MDTVSTLIKKYTFFKNVQNYPYVSIHIENVSTRFQSTYDFLKVLVVPLTKEKVLKSALTLVYELKRKLFICTPLPFSSISFLSSNL